MSYAVHNVPKIFTLVWTNGNCIMVQMFLFGLKAYPANLWLELRLFFYLMTLEKIPVKNGNVILDICWIGLISLQYKIKLWYKCKVSKYMLAVYKYYIYWQIYGAISEWGFNADVCLWFCLFVFKCIHRCNFMVLIFKLHVCWTTVLTVILQPFRLNSSTFPIFGDNWVKSYFIWSPETDQPSQCEFVFKIKFKMCISCT